MSRPTTVLILLSAFLLVRCGDFLDTPQSTSTQQFQVEGAVITKSPYFFFTAPQDMFFIDSSIGFLVGSNGDIYKTVDSGAAWKKKSSGTTLHLFSVMFIDEKIGFVVGDGMKGCLDADCNKGSVLLKTTDGGETWTKKFFADYEQIDNVYFFDAQKGLAIIHTADVPNSRDYHISRTTDGGLSWEFIDLAINSEDEFQVVDNTVFIAGAQQRVFKSSDLGVNWQTLNVPMPVSVNVGAIYFYNKNFGLVDGAELIYRTVDGGANWEVIDPPFSDLDLCHFYTDLEGMNFEAVFKDEGGDTPVFKGTTIYRTVNGGKTWISLTTSEGIYIPISSFPTSDLGFGSNYGEFYTIRRK